jgi:hypothetical protein
LVPTPGSSSSKLLAYPTLLFPPYYLPFIRRATISAPRFFEHSSF